MKVYNYDEAGYYSYVSEAQPNPRLPGSFLIPRNATFLEPPTAPENKAVRFVKNAWEIVNDPQWEERQNARLVIFYRNEPGKDTKVLGGSAYGDCSVDGVLVFKDATLADPSNINVAAKIFEDTPDAWNHTNENGVPLKKVVDGELVARDLQDVLDEDPVALANRLVVFYRNDPPRDTVIIQTAPLYLSQPQDGLMFFRGKPLSDFPKLSYAILKAGEDVQLEDVPQLRVVDGKVVPRTTAAMATDPVHAITITKKGEADTQALLKGATNMTADYTTHLMMVCYAQDVKINPELYSAQELAEAEAILAAYRPLFRRIRAVTAARDAELAKLDPPFMEG